MDAWLHIVVHPCGPSSRSPPPPRGSTHRDASGVNRGRCAIYRKIFMGLAVGPCARVPITHNRRVTNVLLIASSRTETRRTGKNRESSSRERERERERERGREEKKTRKGGKEKGKNRERGRKHEQPLQLDITRQENGKGKLARKRRICVLDHRRMFTGLLPLLLYRRCCCCAC